MYSSIVVGTDGSETAKRAVAQAAHLAHLLGVELNVVSAYEPLRGARIVGAPEGAAKIWAPTPDAQVEAVVGEALAAVRAGSGGDVKVKSHTRTGDAADALLEVADEEGADLIIVGNRGMHSAKRFVLGSVPNKVSHRARCSVLIVATDTE
jgi:nucleotide-binding universal stress UspA family protein